MAPGVRLTVFAKKPRLKSVAGGQNGILPSFTCSDVRSPPHDRTMDQNANAEAGLREVELRRSAGDQLRPRSIERGSSGTG